jgi:hypothetical protein
MTPIETRVNDLPVRDKAPVQARGSHARGVASSSGSTHSDTTHISGLAQLLFPDENRIQQLRADVSTNRYQVPALAVSHDVIHFYLDA